MIPWPLLVHLQQQAVAGFGQAQAGAMPAGRTCGIDVVAKDLLGLGLDHHVLAALQQQHRHGDAGGSSPAGFMRAIAGAEPESMQVQIHPHQTGVDDVAVGMLRFPNGILGVFSCGMTVQADRTTTVAGSDGYLQIESPWFSGGSYQVVRGEETELRQVGQSEMLYALEADHFADVIAGDVTPLISRQDSLGNARVLETLLQQIEAIS